jgi:hypothetical protein
MHPPQKLDRIKALIARIDKILLIPNERHDFHSWWPAAADEVSFEVI